MSSLYASLHVTPRKKRILSDEEDDNVLTPKKIRILPPTPTSRLRKPKRAPPSLPEHLARFQSIQNSLHHALSHSLATSAVAPSENGVVPNVLNNHTLTAAAGLSRTCTVDDLKRLCWLWEWDGETLPREKGDEDEDEDDDEEENPFLEGPSKVKAKKNVTGKQWMRGAMGLVITPTSHLSKSANRRVPAYGIGIEVEVNLDKEMNGGMAAVARWTAKREQRMAELTRKLQRWAELHRRDGGEVPPLPLADLPPLVAQAPKQSALTQRLASLSPKSPKAASTISSTPPTLQVPSSPTRSSPTKPRVTPGKRTIREFAIPFPITPSSLQRNTKATTTLSTPFKPGEPKTPSTNRISNLYATTPSTARSSTFSSTVSTPSTPRTSSIAFPSTPSTSSSSASSFPSTPTSSRPSTPVHQTGSDADTVPATPTTSRRAALYERIRKKSESVPPTPTKGRPKITSSTGMTKDQLLKLGQEEIRRRCLLGRLAGVAESIWMFFASPASATSTTATPRKRRTLPTGEVVQAILKSSPVPISSAEALESINLLTSLCPFFLRQIDVGGEEWLEMPASAAAKTLTAPLSPSRRKGGSTSDDELRTLSPRRVKKESGGLREVRERIKRELEMVD